MPTTVVTPSPGFISIAVRDAQRSASFYERYLGTVRDTFDFGPDSAVFVGWPTLALDDPALVIEHKALYASKGEVPEGEFLIPFGVANVLRHGNDVTIVAYSRAVLTALEAARQSLAR